jgi:ABC-type transport system substrate-binding protein
MSRIGRIYQLCLLCLLLTACTDQTWNNPYPAAEADENIAYRSFSSRPNHLDPARSYSSNESTFNSQIYEPPVQYHYLKTPYEVVPLTCTEVPRPVYTDKDGNPLPADAPIESIGFSTYTIQIQKGIQYQPHQCFAKDSAGRPLYDSLTEEDLADVRDLDDLPERGTRELTAEDYANQIKRIAHPGLQCPIYSVMAKYIVGLKKLHDEIDPVWEKAQAEGGKASVLDLSQFDLEGVKLVDRYTYTLTIKGKYPQMLYWLAMNFFAPVPYEAERFFGQQALLDRNISLDWYPVGTGPYMLTVNNPNKEMILERNPNFRGELYPSEGDPGDAELGLLDDAGKPMPFIDKAIYNLEKESIPYWNKFLQGYYDTSGISSDAFDQAVRVDTQGDASLTEMMAEKDIRLMTSVNTSVYYYGFNMKDDTLGGNSESARKLRQAISIAVDYEEYISIFANGRGIAAQGPVPPGIFGFREGEASTNTFVYDWIDGQRQRKSVEFARQLMAEAGYPNGRDKDTGKPLQIRFDNTRTGPGAKPFLDWFRKQFKKIDIELTIDTTDYNRFQEKMKNGDAQLFSWGWLADYPDPENFLFLLYGPNGKADHHGENAANYQSAEFDDLFKKMESMDNSPERQEIIDRMLKIVQRDCPWIWGYHPVGFGLYHSWYQNAKPNQMANNTLKYKKVLVDVRNASRQKWNDPVVWPIFAILSLMAIGLLPAIFAYRRRENEVAL